MRKLAILEPSQQQTAATQGASQDAQHNQVEEKRMATTLAVFTAYTITAFILMLTLGIIGIEIMLGASVIGLATMGAYHALGAIMALAE